MNREELYKLLKIAEAHNGRCDRCHRVIQVYRYRINQAQVGILKQMKKLEDETGKPDINFDRIKAIYSHMTQRSKMRLNGLIVQSKDETGKKIGNTWRITTKGYNLLNGVPVPLTVIVFDNQVIGHDDKWATIDEIMPEPGDLIEAKPITTDEAHVYGDIRNGNIRHKRFNAKFTGSAAFLRKGEVHVIQVPRLALGSPVMVRVESTGQDVKYKDIAAFEAAWQIVGGELEGESESN